MKFRTKIIEYHCTFVTKKNTIGEYITTAVPREGDMVRINDKTYIVNYVIWDFDSQAVDAISVGVFVK